MCSRTFKIEIGTFLCRLEHLNQNQNILMCSRIFLNQSGINLKTLKQNQNVFDVFHNFLKQKRNFSIESKHFGTKPKRFDVFQNFLKQKRNFSIESKNFGTKPKGFDMFQNFLKQFFLQVLKQFFLQVLLQSLLALSWPLLASATLSRPQLTFSGTFSSL
jgi:hypothetical protein